MMNRPVGIVVMFLTSVAMQDIMLSNWNREKNEASSIKRENKKLMNSLEELLSVSNKKSCDTDMIYH